MWRQAELNRGGWCILRVNSTELYNLVGELLCLPLALSDDLRISFLGQLY